VAAARIRIRFDDASKLLSELLEIRHGPGAEPEHLEARLTAARQMDERVAAAAGELIVYFMELVAKRAKSGSADDDIVNKFRHVEVGGRKLVPEEIASHLSMLIIGGSETFPKTLANAMRRLAEHRRLVLENRNLRQQLQEVLGLENVVGRSPAMAQVFELVKKAARSEANILVLGESGTGKELIARAIHANSPRASHPFVPVDCASLPEQLLESELFGHEKGAFTGAVRSKPGLMETAHRGTLFLDEIAELPAPLQVKLLRVLQERQIRRVGGTALVDVDVRVVSATNRDLSDAIAKGQFREELYYRVNVIAIRLPPLRERAGDVRLLAHTFLKRYGQGRVTAMEDPAVEALERYAWPGNVRELQNVMERACALADGHTITVRDLPDHVAQAISRSGPPPTGLASLSGPVAGADLTLKAAKEQWLQVLEVSYLRDLLARHDGNVSSAAKAAGIDRKTFHRLINKYDLRA